jgi:hypothetical protein
MPQRFTYLPLFQLSGLVSIHLASCGKWPVNQIWVGAFLLGLSAVVVGSLRYGHFLTIGNQDLRNAAEIPKIANIRQRRFAWGHPGDLRRYRGVVQPAVRKCSAHSSSMGLEPRAGI